MVVTVLAIAFLALIGFIAFVGYRSIISRRPSEGDPNSERCSICRQRFDKTLLIERQVGDYRLLYFCRECVERLADDFRIQS